MYLMKPLTIRTGRYYIMILTRQEIINNFIDSLEVERTLLGLTQAQMAKKMEMSVSAYKRLIAGETSKIDIYIAYKTCCLTGKWFFELCRDNSSSLYELVSKLRLLAPSQLRFVSGLVNFETEFQIKIPPEEMEDYVSLLIPTGDEDDGMILDSANVGKINVAAYRKWFGSDLHCAILITSNHFTPVYHINDILLISQTAPRDGDTGIFVNKENGRAYLRRYRQTNPCTLEPLMGYGKTFTINPHDHKEMDKWIKFGRVLSKMRNH